MIQPDGRHIQDLTEALTRCRRHLAETENENAREIYGRVIMRYETVIAELSRASGVCSENTKPAERSAGRARDQTHV
jgi:hypothetical protein